MVAKMRVEKEARRKKTRRASAKDAIGRVGSTREEGVKTERMAKEHD